MTALPASLASWPADAREDYEERAAICESMSGARRDVAERNAERIVREKYAGGQIFVYAHTRIGVERPPGPVRPSLK